MNCPHRPEGSCGPCYAAAIDAIKAAGERDHIYRALETVTEQRDALSEQLRKTQADLSQLRYESALTPQMQRDVLTERDALRAELAAVKLELGQSANAYLRLNNELAHARHELGCELAESKARIAELTNWA